MRQRVDERDLGRRGHERLLGLQTVARTDLPGQMSRAGMQSGFGLAADTSFQ